MAVLEVENLTRKFGGLTALDDLSFSLAQGRIVALVGPNGAGKTTCFNVIAGSLKATKGTVRLAGEVLAGLPPEEVCRRGIARTFQLARPLVDMTVIENVIVGALSRTHLLSEAGDLAYRALLRVGLAEKANYTVDRLTLPDRKMLEAARALATQPKVLLLDEVMAGLRPAEASRLVGLLKQLSMDGMGILMVEHVMEIVMATAEEVIVLHHGAKIAQGSPQEIVRNPLVLQSYLGPAAHA